MILTKITFLNIFEKQNDCITSKVTFKKPDSYLEKFLVNSCEILPDIEYR